MGAEITVARQHRSSLIQFSVARTANSTGLDSRMEGAPSEGPTGNAAPGIDRRPQDSRKGKANMHGIQPIGQKGHTRSITCVQYNRDSDLLFTCAKDSTPTLWYTGNGERVGTFNGHTGANTKLHVSADSSLVMTV